MTTTTERIERFRDEYWNGNRRDAVNLLYEWTKTGVVGRATFIECLKRVGLFQ